MKKILGLAVAAMMVMAMVGAGTWAFFSDTETTTANILSAGTMDLQIGGGGVIHGSVSDVAPGDGEPTNPVSASVTLTKAGTVAGELDIDFDTSVTNVAGAGGTQYEGGSGELGAQLLIALYMDIDQSGTWNTGDITLKSDSTKSSFATTITGTADSGSTTTLVHSTLTQADDFFNGMILEITSGTGSGQARLITDFVQSSNTVTVTDAFSVALDNTSVYSITNLQWDAVDDFQSASWDDIYTGNMGAVDDFFVLYRVPTSVGNDIQGDSVNFTIDFVLEQPAAD